MNSLDLKIEQLPVDELIPYANNARTHSDVQVMQIASSMTEFGFVNPILLGEDNVIIAGHGRLMAAKKLGMNKVPVIRLAHLNETKRKALIIADNKLAENAGWDEELLKQELAVLDELELDFDLSIAGFSDEELDNILLGNNDADGLTDDNAKDKMRGRPPKTIRTHFIRLERRQRSYLSCATD